MDSNLSRPCDGGKRPDIVPVIGAADLEALRLRQAWAVNWRRVHGLAEPEADNVVSLADRRRELRVAA